MPAEGVTTRKPRSDRGVPRKGRLQEMYDYFRTLSPRNREIALEVMQQLHRAMGQTTARDEVAQPQLRELTLAREGDGK